MTPWRFQREVENDFSSGNRRELFPIYTTNGPFKNPATATTEYDAEFICRACNSHGDLLKACADAAELLSVYLPDSLPALKSIKAAVDKAKGKQ